jgi:hypothetical protein
VEPQRWSEPGSAHACASRDVLELMLLHGDCGFLLDLQEL